MYKLPETQGAPPPQARGRLIEALCGSSTALLDIARNVPSTTLLWRLAHDKGVSVRVRRDELIDVGISGNKLYKLWGHLQEFHRRGKCDALVSFGGAYSNHLHALAIAGKYLGLNTVAIIRGQEPRQYSPTLQDLQANGMRLIFISRADYSRRYDVGFQLELSKAHQISKSGYWIPEGGGGAPGVRGCIRLGSVIAGNSADRDDYVLHACGTATTLAGLVHGFSEYSRGTGKRLPAIMGISVLNSGRSHAETVHRYATRHRVKNVQWSVSNQYAVGGYAKRNPEFDHFIEQFTAETQLKVDHVYNAKVFFALSRMIKNGLVEQGSKVTVIHSGGLQGSR